MYNDNFGIYARKYMNTRYRYVIDIKLFLAGDVSDTYEALIDTGAVYSIIPMRIFPALSNPELLRSSIKAVNELSGIVKYSDIVCNNCNNIINIPNPKVYAIKFDSILLGNSIEYIDVRNCYLWVTPYKGLRRPIIGMDILNNLKFKYSPGIQEFMLYTSDNTNIIDLSWQIDLVAQKALNPKDILELDIFYNT